MANEGWLDKNRGRSYPFKDHFEETVPDTSSGTVLGVARLPNPTIVDFQCWIHPVVEFDPQLDEVYLSQITRDNTNFYFEFRSNNQSLANWSLQFTVPQSSPPYQTFFADASYSGGSTIGDIWLWGSLTIGDLDDLLTLLPDNSYSITGNVGEATIQPALIYPLQGNVVTSLSIGNKDRTRVVRPPQCGNPSWPPGVKSYYVEKEGMTGTIYLVPGFNCELDIIPELNEIVITPLVGGGKGEPNEEIPLFAGEIPPTGSEHLDGSYSCGEVVRSINGISTAIFNIMEGAGVQVTTDQGNNKVTIDFNLDNLAQA